MPVISGLIIGSACSLCSSTLVFADSSMQRGRDRSSRMLVFLAHVLRLPTVDAAYEVMIEKACLSEMMALSCLLMGLCSILSLFSSFDSV